jgi:hypothetical protein
MDSFWYGFTAGAGIGAATGLATMYFGGVKQLVDKLQRMYYAGFRPGLPTPPKTKPDYDLLVRED